MHSLNRAGTSIMGAWQQCSSIVSSEFLSSFLNSSPTKGGVIVSLAPHIRLQGIVILDNSSRRLCLTADLAMSTVRSAFSRVLTISKISSTSSLLARLGS